MSFTVFHYDPEALQSVGVVTASSLDLLDSIFINSVSLPPSDPPTPDTPFVGSFGRIYVVANFQVMCASGFFGADCSATCETRDDGLGHFTCDPVSGGRVCLEGYTGVEGNCTECETSPGCCESECKFQHDSGCMYACLHSLYTSRVTMSLFYDTTHFLYT